ncbi:MAG: carbohydrate-binding family 9-like protein, partial [Verrucomicrobiota bacterium]|nr:carbohydrate-binding family 9-like protein [Verrucomicrobiota bacterium]
MAPHEPGKHAILCIRGEFSAASNPPGRLITNNAPDFCVFLCFRALKMPPFKLKAASILFLAAVASALPATSLAAEVFECRWAGSSPVIDGKLDGAVWRQAQVVESFQSAWLPEDKRKPPTHTAARLLWDREYLYFAAEMEDTDVFANVTEQDGAIWKCDVFELFFKPATDKPGYYEFEVNAANAKLDMFLPSRGAGGYDRHAKERPFHIESAVQVRGTLNDWSDTDKGWTVEGRIPWRDFLPTGGRPAPGEVWQHSLCRYDYSAGLEKPALSTNTPLREPNFHRYEDYVPLK